MICLVALLLLKSFTRRYQYNPDADATLYASRLLRAASILEFLLTDPDNKS